MITTTHLNKPDSAALRRRSSARPRRAVGLELLILALSAGLGKLNADAHLRLVELAYELGAGADQVPEQVRHELAAGSAFAAGFLSGAAAVQPELAAQPDQAGATVPLEPELDGRIEDECGQAEDDGEVEECSGCGCCFDSAEHIECCLGPGDYRGDVYSAPRQTRREGHRVD